VRGAGEKRNEINEEDKRKKQKVMNRRDKNINGNSEAAPGKEMWRGIDGDQLLNREDSTLFDSFSNYMKGRLDLEEARNDPSLPAIEKVVEEMITDYSANSTKRAENENFIKDSLAGAEKERKLREEIKNIKLEIHRSDIDGLSAEWVKEWHEKKKRDAVRGKKTDEIRDFITSSLEPVMNEPEIKLNNKEDLSVAEIPQSGKGIRRSLLFRYISLSAAAVIGVFMLIRTLLPSSTPEKLYSTYYKPFNAISSVTRDGAANKPDDYSVAVERYRLGDYRTAAAGFSNVMLVDSSVIAPRFFMGITQIAIGNYNQAVSLLTSVAGRPGEYHKEALWYLGMTYLKTGEKEKALKCFDLLSQSSGSYREPSEAILRRLK
jgi:hypothetical protein